MRVRPPSCCRNAVLAVLRASIVTLAPVIAWAEVDDDALFDLSLSELLDIEVTSVSKQAESVMDAPAAVFVISANDIRRSGATNVPEALRLAPGVLVTQIDAGKWSVSTRGSNGRFANKLLVLIDGRAVYSPLFSGVFWDARDTILEDIDRIEVIRGPGGTLWGANAVNGVINIITRSASETQGTLLSLHAGPQERGVAAARFGGTLGDAATYRIFARQVERDNNRLADGNASRDALDQKRLGFRLDLSPSSLSTATIQGESYQSDSRETVDMLSVDAPYRFRSHEEQRAEGYHLLARWNQTLANSDQLTLQTWYEWEDRDWFLSDINQDSADFYVDYRSTRLTGHDLLGGLGYRIIDSNIATSERVTASPPPFEEEVINIFLQDEITLVPQKWFLTVGSKFELNDFTGWEVQPNLRLLWTPDERYSFWAAVSQAVRTPARADRNYRFLFDARQPANSTLPIFTYANAGMDFHSETLVAWEGGLKARPLTELSVEATAFYNDYRDLRSLQLQPPVCEPSGRAFPNCIGNAGDTHLTVDLIQTNDFASTTWGAEVNVDWRPTPRWHLQAFYSHLETDTSTAGTGQGVGILMKDPTHQASLRLSYDPLPEVQLDMWLRYVSELTAIDGNEIDGYTTSDLRVAWHPHHHLQVALVGKNLFTDDLPQYRSEILDIPLTEIGRSAYLQVQLEF